MLLTEMSWLQNPVEAVDISLTKKVQTVFWAHSPPNRWVTGVLSQEQSGRNVILTTLHHELRLRMSGVIPPLLHTRLHGF